MNDQTILTDEVIAAIETQEAPQQETPTMVIQDAAPAGKKIFKTHGEEFSLEIDFAAIAAALNLAQDQITWTIVDDAADGIDGHSLVGVPAA